MPNFRSASVVDNWSLDLAAEALGTGGVAENSPRVPPELAARARSQRIDELLKILDLVVLYDEIYHDGEHEHLWKESPLEKLSSLFVAVSPTESEKDSLARSFGVPVGGDYPRQRLVRHGALYYLGLSQELGLAYWPQAARAGFLASVFGHTAKTGFVGFLQTGVKSALAEAVEDALTIGERTAGRLTAPGFGTVVLSSCESRNSIAQAVLELRDSREARAFRMWIRQMDEALRRGNVREVSQGLREVRGVLADTRQSLGLDDSLDTPQIQIGLSPSIAVTGRAFLRGIRRLAPRPLHVTFLERYVDNALSTSDLRVQVNRLFLT